MFRKCVQAANNWMGMLWVRWMVCARVVLIATGLRIKTGFFAQASHTYTQCLSPDIDVNLPLLNGCFPHSPQPLL